MKTLDRNCCHCLQVNVNVPSSSVFVCFTYPMDCNGSSTFTAVEGIGEVPSLGRPKARRMGQTIGAQYFFSDGIVPDMFHPFTPRPPLPTCLAHRRTDPLSSPFHLQLRSSFLTGEKETFLRFPFLPRSLRFLPPIFRTLEGSAEQTDCRRGRRSGERGDDRKLHWKKRIFL